MIKRQERRCVYALVFGLAASNPAYIGSKCANIF
jgi:hypothetical protein